MGGMRIFVIAWLAGCLPRPQPAQPTQPVTTQQAPVQQTAQTPDPNTAGAQGGVTVANGQQQGAPQPYPQQGGPYPQQGAPQPYPQQGAPQPYPQQGAPQPYPPQGYPQQPYPQQGQPYPQQYPQQGYPAYTQPAPQSSQEAALMNNHGGGRLHDGEVVADFAIVGTLASLDIITRQDVHNGAVTFLLLGGVAGGGGVGYLLTNKFEIDTGTAHATTLGLTLGIANGALLVEPTGWTRTESVLNLLFLGGAIGAGGGFAYGRAAHLTAGQSTFVGNMALLGSATAALGAITGSRDGKFGDWESGTLAVGLDGGTAAGMIVAPSLNWSAHRANIVFASTVIGAFAGGMLAGLVTPRNNGQSATDNGDIVAASMTAGLWGGFALGVMMTKGDSPDPQFAQPSAKPRTASTPPAIMPWAGRQGALGLMTGGSF